MDLSKCTYWQWGRIACSMREGKYKSPLVAISDYPPPHTLRHQFSQDPQSVPSIVGYQVCRGSIPSLLSCSKLYDDGKYIIHIFCGQYATLMSTRQSERWKILPCLFCFGISIRRLVVTLHQFIDNQPDSMQIFAIFGASKTGFSWAFFLWSLVIPTVADYITLCSRKWVFCQTLSIALNPADWCIKMIPWFSIHFLTNHWFLWSSPSTWK